MNKLMFFDRKFNLKNILMVNENLFVADIVSAQKIEIIHSKAENINEGDFCIASENKFIGVVVGININTNNTTTITISYVDEIFNIESIVSNLSGNVFNWIKEQIEINISENDDGLLQIPIIINNNLSDNYTAVIEFQSNNLKECLKEVFNISKTFLEFEINFDNGKPTALICNVKNCNDKNIINLKHNLPIVSNIKRTYTQSQNKNKLIMLPDEGVEGEQINFYLLKDGTISTNSEHADRFKQVNQVIKYYNSEATAETLVDVAKQELLGQEYNHNIQFDILENESYNLNLYDRVNFYDVDAVYNSIVTKVTIKDKIKTIVLGFVRKLLSDKLKTSQSKSTSTAVSGGAPQLTEWGDIAGTITQQSDLANELSARVPTSRKINDKTLEEDISLTASDVDAVATAQKGVAGGVASLDMSGKIPDEQLPPISGLVLGETSSTAYRGDRGKAAYDHSQILDGSNPHNTAFSNLSDIPTTLAGFGIVDAYTITEINDLLSDIGGGSGSGSCVYDKIIKTQTEFNELVSSENWLGAKTVAIIADGGAGTNGEYIYGLSMLGGIQSTTGILIPDTVIQIHGYGDVKIIVYNYVYSSDNRGLFKYGADKRLDATKYEIKNISLKSSFGTAGSGNVYGFYFCGKLINCSSEITISLTNTKFSSAAAFHSCYMLINCSAICSCYNAPCSINGCRYLLKCTAYSNSNRNTIAISGADLAVSCTAKAISNTYYGANCTAFNNLIAIGCTGIAMSSTNLTGSGGGAVGFYDCKLALGCTGVALTPDGNRAYGFNNSPNAGYTTITAACTCPLGVKEGYNTTPTNVKGINVGFGAGGKITIANRIDNRITQINGTASAENIIANNITTMQLSDFVVD